MGGKNYQVLITGLLFLLPACVKDKPGNGNVTVPTDKSGVYIVCEGQFTAGNGSLYLYKPLQDTVYGDIYAAANGQGIGDVFQSMCIINDKMFMAVNNSGRVVASSRSGVIRTGVIDVPSPRYILPVNDQLAYVSSLYHNKIYVINTVSLSLVDSITLPAQNTEGMVLYGTDAYVCAWDTAVSAIYKINTQNNQLTQTIPVAGYAPHSIVTDKDQMLWVLSGNPTKHKPSYWTRVDPSTGSILASYAFPASADALKPVFNKTRDTLYYIEANYNGGTTDNGIYRMDIHAASLPATPFIGVQQYQYYWSLGIDPSTGYIYVGDPKGFNQKGSVTIYRQDGSTVRTFSVGVGPGMFVFAY